MKASRAFTVVLLVLLISTVVAAQNPTANVTVNAAAGRHAIDPRIYGIAYGTTAQLTDLHVPLNRYGGNNTSRYNWQLNADNRATIGTSKASATRARSPVNAAIHSSRQFAVRRRAGDDDDSHARLGREAWFEPE